ncbi:hypothetical protein [Laceyella tengchongensis]|uniref:hypothetical protein n=1 Tax=Laceyella tengchongensis TaxID=574699 RepID=UPI0003B32483|nr:hypothetical protein ADL26_06235 [Thermoactinomyces vulgaris]MRG29595.1 hypothetical protein [Laceyella tengchongensis]
MSLLAGGVLSANEQAAVCAALAAQQDKVDAVLKRLFTHWYAVETRVILFHGKAHDFGCVVDVRPKDKHLGDVPLSFVGNRPVYGTLASVNVDFGLNMGEKMGGGDGNDCMAALLLLFAHWLGVRLREVGGQSFAFPCLMTFHRYLEKGYYHLQTGNVVA